MEKKDLEIFKELLQEERKEIVDSLLRDSETMDELKGGSEGDLADQAYNRSEKTLVMDISKSNKETLRKIDEALARIEKGTYGICEVFGTPIEMERLRVLPYTTLSIKAAKLRSKKKRP